MLDEFEGPSHPKAVAKPAKAAAQGVPKYDSAGSLDDDFARQLQLGMQDLLGEIQDSVCNLSVFSNHRLPRPVLRVNLVSSQKELQDQFEHLVKELSDAATTGKATPSSSLATPKPAAVPANFQDRIKQTMERMKSSEAEVDAAVADSEGDDFLAEMLKQMQGAAGEGESDEDFSKMLLTMMEQLTSMKFFTNPCGNWPTSTRHG